MDRRRTRLNKLEKFNRTIRRCSANEWKDLEYVTIFDFQIRHCERVARHVASNPGVNKGKFDET
jgi:hypothetical protein